MAAAGTLSAQQPAYDLLLKDGHVIDPKNGINSVMDVAIAGDKIAAVAGSIPAARAAKVVDASGLYVTPGLIDIHGLNAISKRCCSPSCAPATSTLTASRDTARSCSAASPTRR